MYTISNIEFYGDTFMWLVASFGFFVLILLLIIS